MMPGGADRRAAAPRPTPEPGDAHLVIRFSDESWVEVYGPGRERMFYALVDPGRTVTLSGPGPLQVLLGRPDGVDITVNGFAFDVTPYLSQGIARFTTGDDPPLRGDAAEPANEATDPPTVLESTTGIDAVDPPPAAIAPTSVAVPGSERGG